ncbi:MAG: antitoxin VapB family protein [Nanoarchaeota archaeon]
MVKVISLSNEAYGKLKRIKGDRSFSEVVVNLINDDKIIKRKRILELAGTWKDDSYWEEFKKEVRRNRNRMKLREVNF